MKYLTFNYNGVESAGKITSVWDVKTLSAGGILGQVRWYAPWRRYVFFPDTETLYDASCLAEIQLFLTMEMEKRR